MTYSPALAQRLFPSRRWDRELALLSGSVILVALLAQISWPEGPVPFSGQTLGVLLAGACLGFRRGMLAVGLYLAAGTAGLPIFALAAAGPGVLAGPTGGYLIGFLFAAGTAGLLAEHGFLRTFRRAVLAMALATLPVYVIGLGWLLVYLPSTDVLAAGLVPFLPGALLQLLLAARIVSWSRD